MYINYKFVCSLSYNVQRKAYSSQEEFGVSIKKKNSRKMKINKMFLKCTRTPTWEVETGAWIINCAGWANNLKVISLWHDAV